MNSTKLAARSSCALRRRLCCETGTTRVRSLSTTPTAAAPSTKIEKLVRDSIRATGPISVSTYMQLCLAHPTHGYYMNPSNPVFGKQGDFITSPEISQVFGELIAIWHLSRWFAAGQPSRIRVVELGPGRGTLAADALRTWSQFPAARTALRNGGTLHLVETSEAMRALQRNVLERMGVLKHFDNTKDFVRWHDSLEDVNDSELPVDSNTFTIVIAHEFFDALPVHVLEKKHEGWHELHITDTPSLSSASTTILKPSSYPISASSSTPAPTLPPLRLALSRESSPLSKFLGSLSPRYAALPVGARLEVSPTSFRLARSLAELVNDPKGAGGSALVVDYGHEGISGNSLRAFKKHKIVDIFETPGECDLTANVDFALLKEAISDAATPRGSIAQRDFLLNSGLEARLRQLVDAKTDAAGKDEMIRAARRLVDPTGMGVQYKMLGVTGTGVRSLAKGEEAAWPFLIPEKVEEKTE